MSAQISFAPDPPSSSPSAAPSGWWAALCARQQRNELALPVLFFGCAMYMLGVFTSRALTSLSPLLLVLAAVLNRDRGIYWREYRRNPVALIPAALYGLVVLSALYTENWQEWRHQVFRQSILIVVPLAIGLAPPLPTRYRQALVAWWLAVGTAVAAGTLVHFFRHKEAIEESILRSKTQSAITGVGHIYFSVMLAFTALYGLEVAFAPTCRFGRAGRWAAGVAAVVCVVTLHLLAYRTGLVALYGALAVGVIRLVVVQRRFLVGGLLIVGLVAAPLVAYRTITSVERRVAQTNDDLNRFRSRQDINEYSLSQRLAAWYTAGTLVSQHWLLGVGPADVRQVMDEQYARESFGLRPENRILPHNQYLQHLLGGGIVALLLLLAMLGLPLVAEPTRTVPMVRNLMAVVGFGLFFDSMFEVQFGLNPFVLHYAILVVGPWQQARLARRLRANP